MSIIKQFLNKILILIQIPLVIIFIIFEELIWEGIARPIYLKIKSLQILKRLERALESIPRGLILLFFIIIFTIVESAGVIAGILFLKGQILLGLFLYFIKIPIAGFTFWLFKVTKSKLLSFGWFEFLYNKMLNLFLWFKRQDIYIVTLNLIRKVKIFLSGGEFRKRLKELYIDMKKIFDRR